jgi:hypothetical protein
MTTEKNDRFQEEQNRTLDRIIALIDKKNSGISVPLVIDMHSLSPGHATQAAEKEVLSLFAKGIGALKTDGLAGALTKVSLRSTTLAVTLGVTAPQYEQIPAYIEYTSGFEAGIFWSKRLIEAAEGDIAKSTQVLQQKLYAEKLREEEDPGFKKQMAVSLNTLVKAYINVCRDLKKEIDALEPAPFKPKGKSFDL